MGYLVKKSLLKMRMTPSIITRSDRVGVQKLLQRRGLDEYI
jgi:hypothetical protein